MSGETSDAIPLSRARAAHAGTSFDPEKRAAQEQANFAATLQADREALAALADTDEKRATLAQEFERYAAGYRTRYLAHLDARARIVSWMIAGPSNFPRRRMEKRNATSDRRLQELLDFRARALKAIRRTLCPEERPIMAGDSDAVTRLEAEIGKLELEQDKAKKVNAAIRTNAKAGEAAQLAALAALDVPRGLALLLLKPDFAGRVGFPSFELTNRNANIRRLRERLAAVSRAKAAPEVVADGAHGIRLEDSPADNRVRLFFPGKPDASVRDALKSNGFRWAPSVGAWQAYRNPRSLAHARAVAGITITTEAP